MISLAKVLSGEPILLAEELYFYQPTIQEIVDMGEGKYWALINLWTIKRKDMIEKETEQTSQLDDFTV